MTMPARRRQQIFAIAGLLILNALLGWYFQRLRKEYRDHTQWIYTRPAPSTTSTGSVRPTPTVGTQDFGEIVNHNLFTQERSNQAPEERQQAKAPELPLLYGTMNLGNGWFALMAPGDQPSRLSKRVLPGEEIGGYKLVSIANSQVVVAWGEKTFTIDASESARRIPRIIDRTVNVRSDHPAPAPSVATASAGGARVTSVAPTPASTRSNKPATAYFPPGADPDAPVGTIVAGRRKVVVPTPFGPQVQWEEVEQPGASTATPNPKKEQ